MANKKLVGLNQASQQKKQSALLKTEQAIAKLSQQEQKITIRAVAREAGVSVSYIYKYPELAYRIQQLREQQKYSLIKSDHQADSPQQQIKKLQQEKAKLVQEINKLRNEVDNQATREQPLTQLQAANIKLRTENQQLKQELQYTKRKLQEAREFILRGKEQQETPDNTQDFGIEIKM